MLGDLIQSIYNATVRPLLPTKVAVYNGIPVRNIRLLDRSHHFQDHKAEFLEPLSEAVSSGDTVVQVGGGIGTSTVVAAETAGPEGRAVTFEASEELVDVATETLRLNRKTWRDSGPAEVKHAVVGEIGEVMNQLGDPEEVAPEELPACDVLGLDCEGAELEILRNLNDLPPIVVVETHGWLDSPTTAVREQLNTSGYEIVDEVRQVPDRDNYVLTATLN